MTEVGLHRFFFVLLVGMALAFAGCGDTEEETGTNGEEETKTDNGNGDNGDNGPNGEEEPEACEGDEDCDAEYECIDGECVHLCEAVTCDAHEKCEVTNGTAACYCISDEACDAGHICEDGECVFDDSDPCNYLPDASAKVGEPCTADGYCGGGLCVQTSPDSPQRHCVQACYPTECPQICPSNQTCQGFDPPVEDPVSGFIVGICLDPA